MTTSYVQDLQNERQKNTSEKQEIKTRVGEVISSTVVAGPCQQPMLNLLSSSINRG